MKTPGENPPPPPLSQRPDPPPAPPPVALSREIYESKRTEIAVDMAGSVDKPIRMIVYGYSGAAKTTCTTCLTKEEACKLVKMLIDICC